MRRRRCQLSLMVRERDLGVPKPNPPGSFGPEPDARSTLWRLSERAVLFNRLRHAPMLRASRWPWFRPFRRVLSLWTGRV
ncbi:MAG: hypothetical protein ACI8QC_000561 [Planctomycetota bacterium]|jgi:hypothetical protein